MPVATTVLLCTDVMLATLHGLYNAARGCKSIYFLLLLHLFLVQFTRADGKLLSSDWCDMRRRV